jgi:hypothetical protein
MIPWFILLAAWLLGAGANVCKLEKDRLVKNLATKTPYAYMLPHITPENELNVSFIYF